MFKNMKIKKKLILAFLLTTLISSVSGVVSYFVLETTDKNYSDALIDYGFAQGDVGKAMIIITDNRRLVRDVVSFSKPENVEAAVKQLAINREKYDKYAADVETTLVSDEAKAAYAHIQEELIEYRKMQDKFVELGQKASVEEKAELRQRLIDEFDPVYEDLYNAYVEIMDIKVTRGDELSVSLSNQTDFTMTIISLVTIISVGIAVMFGIFIARGIANPIALCVERLNKLSQGDLESDVPTISTKDEVGVLAQATKTLVETIVIIIGDMTHGLGEIGRGNFTVQSENEAWYVAGFRPLYDSINNIELELSSTLMQIDQASSQVAVGSDQVSNGAQNLSQGATEQASSVQELSATVTQLSTQIKTNAENAETAKEHTNKVGNEIEQSNIQMQEMIEAMNDIKDKSNEIGKIIKTIDDIAFQTNILALNAAVEAARAGVAGKGFAVVADEVRNLAGKSAEAAKNTESLIEQTVMAVENGANMADVTAQAMLGVVEGAKEITVLIDQIADASAQQAVAVDQFSLGMDQISSVVQNNAATAEESAASSEELSAQADTLKRLVSKFQLRNM